MMRSLTFKWSVTLLLSSLTGVILVGLFAYRTTQNEYDRLRVEQARSAVVSQLTTYYQTNGSWDGLENWLAVFACGAAATGAGMGSDPRREREIFRAVSERLRESRYRDGAWTLDYRRLRLMAVKSH